MTGYKRTRSSSKYEETNISSYVETVTKFESKVHYYGGLEAAKDLSKTIVLIGTPEQLADSAVSSLPFYEATVKASIEAISPGKLISTWTGDGKRVFVGAIPSEASRHNAPTRPDVVTSLVSSALKDSTTGANADVFVRSTEELPIGAAVAKAVPNSFSAKQGLAEESYLKKDVPTVRVFFPGPLKKSGSLEIVAKYIQLCKLLVDAPTNLLDTTTFPEVASAYAAKIPGVSIDIISGEDLREQGYGGLYGVGKAAEYPPALVTLTYKPSGMDPQQKIAFVGKGIVYDTGGLAIKTPGSKMWGMKDDMGGAAAVFCGFLANSELESPYELSATLCLADNAVGPRAQRNDDIARLKSGVTVEINNTDAEGRLVLSDGVFHASALLPFTPTTIIDMATLTGAQGTCTGKRHAAVFCNSDEGEKRVVAAGRACGDLCFPVLYVPEFHKANLPSTVADFTNTVANASDAPVSCAGQFIGNNLAKSYKNDWIHVDIASPATIDRLSSGYGVTLAIEFVSGHMFK